MNADNSNRPAMHSTSANMRRLCADLFQFNPRRCCLVLLTALILPLCSGLNILLTIPILNTADIPIGPSRVSAAADFIRAAFDAVGISPSLGGALAVFVGVSTVYSILLWQQVRLNAMLRVEFVLWKQKQLYRTVGQARWEYFLKVRSQDIAHGLSVEADRVLKGLKAMLSLVSNLSLTFVFLAFSVLLAPAMTGVVALGGLVLMPIVVPWLRSSRQSGAQLSGLTRRFYRDVVEHLSGIKEAKSMGAEGRHAAEFDSVTELVSRTRMKFESGKAAALFFFSFGSVVALGVVAFVGIRMLSTPIADLILLFVIYSRLTPRLLKVQSDFQDVVHMLPAYESFEDLRQNCELWAEERPLANTNPLSLQHCLEISDIGFRYDRQLNHWALRHACFTIPAQSITAISGPSGAGKSTLADLLLGLLHPEEGCVEADGVNIGNDMHAWRQMVGYVPQETFLLHDTLRANLCWGCPNATDEQMSDALQLAAARDVVESLPHGLDTIVGERGERLSGGERQRIALARALLRQPSLLILDEPTSSLDAESCVRIQNALCQIADRVTVVVIAHDPSMVDLADQVFELRNGRLLDSSAFEAGDQAA